MTKRIQSVQKMDTLSEKLRALFPTLPFRIRERSETLVGKGWGFRFEWKRTDTTLETTSGESENER